MAPREATIAGHEALPDGTAVPEPIYCRGCGYNLKGLLARLCPECGRPFDLRNTRSYLSLPPVSRWREALVGMLTMLGVLGIMIVSLALTSSLADGEMALIAKIHAIWLLLLPTGAVIVVIGARRHIRIQRGMGLAVAGILLLVLSVPAVLFCLSMWPLDFLIPGAEVRESVVIQGYRIEFVQVPGMDFYETYYEVTRSDGKTTRIMIDSDDSKMWFPTADDRNGRIYFRGLLDAIGPETSYVDPEAGVIFGGYYNEVFTLEMLSFDESWTTHEDERNRSYFPGELTR